MDEGVAADRFLRLAVDVVNLRAGELDAAGLARFLVEHGEAPPIQLGAREVRELLAVRDELGEVFDAGGVGRAAMLVNRLLERAQAPPRLIAEDGTARIGRCGAPGCGAAFAGGPRNHQRRYCSAACANRARVAAFRARRRA